MAARALASMATLAVVSGCAEYSPTGTDPDPKTSETRLPEAADRPPPCDAKCQAKREKRRVENERRCASLVNSVDLTWRITATPTDRGQEIGLRMLVVNRSDARLSGDTLGAMRVEPGRRNNGISWGGSSSDVLWQKPHTTTNREVWHERRPPGWHPIGDRVTAFSYDAYSYAPGRPVLVCHFPAAVEAPQGLVEDHPSGRWIQQPET